MVRETITGDEREAPLPKLPGTITISGGKLMALLAYEDRYEPEGAPRSR